MGLLNSFFKNESKVDKILSTGEINWRYKPIINATQNFPTFLKFIEKLEDENSIQFGLHNDIANEEQSTLILSQAIYDLKSKPLYRFSFFLNYIHSFQMLMFIGGISNFLNPREMLNFDRNNTVNEISSKNTDLSISEYERIYWQVLKDALTVFGLNPNEYSIKRNDGGKCIYKVMESDLRNSK